MYIIPRSVCQVEADVCRKKGDNVQHTLYIMCKNSVFYIVTPVGKRPLTEQYRYLHS